MRPHFHILLCLIVFTLLKSKIKILDNKLYNISCRPAVYRRVYMQPAVCSVVMSHRAAVQTVCCSMVGIQINTYLSGTVYCRYSLQHRLQVFSYLGIQTVIRNKHNLK